MVSPFRRTNRGVRNANTGAGFPQVNRSAALPYQHNYQLLSDAGLGMEGSGIYNIIQDKKTEEFSLEYVDQEYKLPERIYGNINWYIDYYWNGFVNMNYISGLLLTGSAGAGKFLRHSEPVKVPGGWRPIGSLIVGDEVTGRDGLPTKVTAVYPQGIKQLYKVKFSDGRYVDAGGEHLWEVHSRVFPKKTKGDQHGSKVINTDAIREYLDGLSENETSEFYIDLIIPEDGPKKELNLHPYLLGVLMGDGYIKNLEITNSNSHIFNRVKSVLPEGYEIKRYEDDKETFIIVYIKNQNLPPKVDLHYELTTFGLTHTRLWEKFIPDVYLEGSLEQRYELLRGLVDTAGEIGINDDFIYSTTSKRLANDIVKLARSLGGLAHWEINYSYYTYDGVKKRGRPTYIVYFRFNNNNKDVVTLPKRLERIKESNQYSKNLKLRIVSVEKIDEDDAVCISVDNADKLYVTKDYIVTHNTEIARSLCNKAVNVGMRVINVSNVKYSPELIAFLDKQEDTLMFFDEFGKVFNYSAQGKMLPLLSNTFGRRRICIIADNDLSGISTAIKNRPGRLRYSKDIIKLDPTVMEDYLKYNPVAPDFKVGLMTLYRKSLVFIFDHLQALVTEHQFNPELPFKDILNVLNLSGFEAKPMFLLSSVILVKDGEETPIDMELCSSYPNILYKDRVNEDYIYKVTIKDPEYKPADNEKVDVIPSRFNHGDSLPKGVLTRLDCSVNTLVDSEPKSMTFVSDGYKIVYTLTTDEKNVKDDGANNYNQPYIRK